MLPTGGHGQDFNGNPHGSADAIGHRSSDKSSQKMAPTGGSQESCRRIHLDKNYQGGRSPFVSNYVSTTKYELWNIVPKNLLEQFQRAANFWFLTVSIFQMLPGEFSPTNQYATILPLCCVLFVTFCKDAWEDYGRRRDDRRVNNQRCKVVDCSSETTTVVDTRWKNLVVGSYVHLERDAPVPADMILLSSSNEDGVAYVDTAQLDGETSLKPKFALEDTMNLLDLMDIKKLEGFIDTEQPNELVQSFSGTLFLRGHPRGSPIDVKNFLLRGSTLRNTTWIFGVVVFTGVDTKLVQNSKRTPSKRSHVEVLANRLLLIVFGMLVLLSLASSVARAIWLAGGGAGSAQMRWVWPETDPLQDNQYLAFITFMIGYNNLIPISLYVTTDLVRTFQGMMMEWDESMYHPVTDSFCRVKNSGLCENLGQVDFVLSDKTGTLTENKMSFKACCIRGRVYGCWDADVGPVKHVVALPPADICVPLDLNLWRLPAGTKPTTEERQTDRMIIDHFFLCLATCHTAIVEELPEEMRRISLGVDLEATMSMSTAPSNSGRRNSGCRRGSRKVSPTDAELHSPKSASDEVPRPTPELFREAQSVTFRSSSPDEEALVAAARDYGYFFRKRVASRVVVNVRGKDQCYTVLACNEFSSERKRMSVLISRTTSLDATPTPGAASSSATLYVKGADSVMFERLKASEGGQKVASQLKHQLNKFASCGLRTLVLAKREVSAAQADLFVQKMLDAKGSLLYREMALEEVADEMERHLEFLGITAIEDKIQQGVPETINMLLRAGIKVWMLTGDNMETAINIGVACSLINQSSMKQYMLDIPSNKEEAHASDVLTKLEGFYNDISHNLRLEKSRGSFQYCVVVHGSVLYIIMDEYNVRLRQLFLAIAGSSCSVIACRLAPAQKAALVKLVRSEVVGSPLTLAIGDGGNDVSMIQEAHVGVGILGVEGRQAANASDFVISQFRFLRTLLLVHGRWNLRRIGIVIGYSFYKNFTLVLPMVYYAFYTGFSGTTLYDSWLLTCYNLFFTSLPIMIMGVFDFDVNSSMALLVPSLYQLGIKRKYFNSWMLIGWIARGTLHSLLIFIGVRFLFEGSMADEEGNVPDYLVMGSWGYWACVAVVNVTLLLHTKAWMDWLVLVVAGSALIFLPILMLYSQEDNAEMLNSNMVGVGSCLFGRLGSWLCMLLVASACALADLAVSFARKVSQPDVADILQEVQLGHLNGTERYSKFRPLPLPAANAAGSRVVTQVEENDDDDGLDDNSEQDDSDDSPEMHASRAERYLQRLPAPPPRMHQVKPVDGVGLEPLQSRHDRDRKSRSNARVAAAVARTRWKRFGGANRLTAIVPSGDTCRGSSVSKEGNSSSSGSYERSMSWDPGHAFTARGGGPLNRLWRSIMNLIDYVYRSQWCEMTVGELLGGFSYNKMMVSKHFKSAIRQYGTGATHSNSRGDDHKHRGEAPNGGESPHNVFSPSGSQPVSSQDSEASLGTYGHADSRNSQREGGLFKMTADGLNDTTEVVKDLIYSVITLRFFSENQENEFRKYFSKQAVLIIQKSLLALSVAMIMYNLYEVIAYDSARTIMRAMVIVGIVPATVIVVICLRQGIVANNAEWYIAAFIMVIIAVKHGYDILADSIGILANSYMPVFIMAGARIRITFICPVLLFHILGLVLRYWVLSEYLVVETSRFSFVSSENNRIEAEYFVLMIGITTLSLYYAYLIEKLMRQDFIVLFSLVGSKHQAMEILRDMFPDEVINHVITQIRNEQKSRKSSTDLVPVKPIREDCGIVTVLFCDIYDFESLVEKLQPTELVQLLDLVWMMFDRICSTHQLSKIETVGKTYMAAALPEEGKELATGVTRALSTAIAMLELMEKRVLGVGKISNVSVKIGIHTGRAMCGVVGSRKPQFALFGDTVNTASRMQSTGQKNHVHVSNATYDYVAGDHRFQWIPQVTFVKGKGDMNTYLLRGHSMPSRRMSGGTGGSPPVTIAPVDRSCPTPAPPSYPRRPDPPRPLEMAPALEPAPGTGTTMSNTGSMSTEATSSGEASKTEEDGHPAAGTGPFPESVGQAVRRKSGGEVTIVCEPTVRADSEPARERVDGRESENTDEYGNKFGYATSRETANTLHTDTTPSMPIRVKESLLGISISELNYGVALWTRRLSLASPRSSKLSMSRSSILRFLCCNHCQRGKAKEVHEVLENSGQDIKAIWVSLQAFWACYAAESLFLLLGRQGRNSRLRQTVLIVRVSYLGFALIVSLMLHRLGKRCKWDLGLKSSLGSSVFSDVVALLVFTGFVCSTVTNLHCLPHGSEFWNVFEAFFFVMVLMHLCRLNLQGVVPVVLTGITILIMAITTAAQADKVLLLESLVYSLLIFGAQTFAMLRDPRRSRKEHEAICEEHDRVNQLLDSMLPQEVLHEMKAGSLSLAYDYENMTFLFADIVGFTSFCFTHTPEQAVNLVTKLFAEFDETTVSLGIYKVCTIGDAYVVVNEPRTQVLDKFGDCERVFTLATKMLQIIEVQRVRVDFDALNMRIGLHFGRFVGGVIGTKRVRFDIWGEDVIIGNSIESEGIKGRICVSEQAKKVLEVDACGVGNLRFSFNRDIELKNKRIIKSYEVCDAPEILE